MMSSEQDIFCPIRKCRVKGLPEELVRQKILHHLIENLHFPSGGIAVEKSLQQMPLKTLKAPPLRRADIICFYKEHPLLLIECKAVPINQKTIRQIIGYNWYLNAPYIAITNQEEIRLGWFDKSKNDHSFIDYIPNYHELISNMKFVK